MSGMNTLSERSVWRAPGQDTRGKPRGRAEGKPSAEWLGARAAGGAARRQAVASSVPFEFPGRTILPGSLPLITTHVDAEGSFQEAEVDP